MMTPQYIPQNFFFDMENKTYSLQRYRTRADRYTCPACGRTKCFTRYVDEDGQMLDETVGRCDHEVKCGYHYTPKQWFADHPTSRDNDYKPIRRKPTPKIQPKQEPKPKIDFIDIPVLTPYRQRLEQSTLIQSLIRLVPEKKKRIIEVAQAYGIGADDNGWTIYPQFDYNCRLRTAKSMAYDNRGHRVKSDDKTVEYDRIAWLHRYLIGEGLLPEDFHLQQCMGGEHLLEQRPDATVAVVEAEKTAFVAASLWRGEYVWVSVGSDGNLTPRMCQALRGRNVLLFPDANAVDLWLVKMKALTFTGSVKMVEWYTNEPQGSKRDIADVILEQYEHRLT